ncbi:hypothetical protein [Phaeospirillum tilakii]|uniref:Uncharacterized protein n=1 Tax=Phaeospirillum tilakii TaxID=741673 RepID=A0ABW5C8N6_9PROT
MTRPAFDQAGLAALLADPATVKVLAVPGPGDLPRLVPVPALQEGDQERLVLPERHESAESQRGLLRALWYDRPVALLLTHPDGRALELRARPLQAHVTGPLFLRHYQELRGREGDVGLSAVWEIAVEAGFDQSLAARDAAEAARHPGFTHLDRIAV